MFCDISAAIGDIVGFSVIGESAPGAKPQRVFQKTSTQPMLATINSDDQ
jgi:hypothetical protein